MEERQQTVVRSGRPKGESPTDDRAYDKLRSIRGCPPSTPDVNECCPTSTSAPRRNALVSLGILKTKIKGESSLRRNIFHKDELHGQWKACTHKFSRVSHGQRHPNRFRFEIGVYLGIAHSTLFISPRIRGELSTEILVEAVLYSITPRNSTLRIELAYRGIMIQRLSPFLSRPQGLSMLAW